MSDLSPEERNELYAAARARSELEQTEQAFDDLRAEMVVALFEKAPTPEERERMYLGVKILDRVRLAVRMVAANEAIVKNNELIRSILDGQDPA